MFNQAPEDQFLKLVEAARAYCALIERLDRLEAKDLLDSAAHLLLRINAAIITLPRPQADGPLHPLVDMETRFALFQRIRDQLGECDPYWMEYDHALTGQLQSGSLADDLTDIYFDLRRGLQRLDEGSPAAPFRAVRDWCLSYDLHWGEHLVDAERHIYYLMRDRSR
ncbi:MAG: DUF5063 domain-containing protein [Proteobacteria bacterium]|nr:MAG: DUF5063 domain-containing protein [Pseudomonadota bacterium]